MYHASDTIWSSILSAAAKHPNSKVSKLIKELKADCSQKNIITLLIEIYEHQEFSGDFELSLEYFLNLFENGANENSVLNECGILLLTSSKIYAKRVDLLNQMVQSLISSLNTTDAIEEKKEKPISEAKSKEDDVVQKNKKRSLDSMRAEDIETTPSKKIRLLDPEKRFAKSNSETNKEKRGLSKEKKSSVASPLWVLTSIVDIDDEEESESKKNFKLFTCHIRKSYYGLSRDVPFCMFYKMKDYITHIVTKLDEKQITGQLKGESISECSEYNEKSLLEKKFLNSIRERTKEDAIMHLLSEFMQDETLYRRLMAEQTIQTDSELRNLFEKSIASTNADENMPKNVDLEDSGLGTSSLHNQSTNNSSESSTNDTNHSLGDNTFSSQEDSALSKGSFGSNSDDSINDESTNVNASEPKDEVLNNELLNNSSPPFANEFKANEYDELKELTIDDSQIKVHLPHLDDEGVYFSELDEKDQKMLSPAVIATDVFHCLPNKKENISVIIDDDIRVLYDLKDPPEMDSKPKVIQPEKQNLIINILKINEKLLKRKSHFKLGSEFDLYMSDRKRKRRQTIADPPIIKYKSYRLGDENMTDVPLTPPDSPNSCLEFLGFPDETQDKNRTFSYDSGIELLDSITDLRFGEKDSVSETPQSIDDIVTLSNDVTLNLESSDIAENKTSESRNQTDVDFDVTSEFTRAPSEDRSDIFSIESIANSHTAEIDFYTGKSKIQKWHEHLVPILAKSKERHHFDVFEIGSDIINQIKTDGGNEKIITFGDVMSNKDPSYVSRYFLSTLLLINQNNINVEVINIDTNKPSEWNDFKLQLHNTKRYAVSAEDNIGIIPQKVCNRNCDNGSATMGKNSKNKTERTQKSLFKVN